MAAKKCECAPKAGILVLIIGLLYLLKDLAIVDWTLDIQWFTVAFVMLGAHAVFCKCH